MLAGFWGCSNSAGPQGSQEEETEQEVDSPISIHTDSQDSELRGIVPVRVEGSSDRNFSELRLYVGDEEITTVSNPGLPYEEDLETYAFDNGRYNIRAEADIAGTDSTYSAAVSDTFTNYLLEVDTGGYLSYYMEYYERPSLIISGPDGETLTIVDLSAYAPGETLSLLPPEEVDGNPRYFSITLAVQSYSSELDNTFTGLQTEVSSRPWETHLMGQTLSISRSDGRDPDQRLTVEANNVPFNEDGYSPFIVSEYSSHSPPFDQRGDSLQETFGHYSESDHLLTLINYGWGDQYHPPLMKWEKSLSERGLSTEDTLRYDVEEDFQEMSVYTIEHSPDLKFSSYSFSMSARPDSWDHGSLNFSSAFIMDSDPNYSYDQLDIHVPDPDHLYNISLSMNSIDDPVVSYSYSTKGNLPAEFQAIDAGGDVSVEGNLENLQLRLTGEADYASIILAYTGETLYDDYGDWTLRLPDTLETYALPDVLEYASVEELKLNSMQQIDTEYYDGYGDFFDSHWGKEELDEEGDVYVREKGHYRLNRTKKYRKGPDLFQQPSLSH